eukprot:CAMPEP_0196580394 /NCGR_PEP_ID=MMETSP1081-20130531/28603_1 /TAXON_ID=36882 /ORGANISM="Pyramimonas amylifera, Strain CCMP720" /LENGTH=157 /DNA_ID=CAMNT_0041900251 /DNA_START=191 /DNA_END=664 /DNA_ORIENTATION=+
MTTIGPKWRSNIIENNERILEIARSCKRVAVVGIKDVDKATQPAYFVPLYLQSAGVKVVPVPVFYPDATEMLGEPIFREVQDVPECSSLDIVNLFRKPSDIPGHVEDIIAAKPKCVWFQKGIRNDECAEQFAQAGIQVVQDRCLKVDHANAISQSSL